MGDGKGWRALHIRAHDGLKLFARDYGERKWAQTPFFCLAGLTRNSKDFHEFASAISSDPQNPHRVVCLDSRGRGRSEYDPDWRNYTLRTELHDALDAMAAAGIERAIVVGTSRGGMLAMLMAAMRPGVLAGVVLNDIGPEIGTKGLARIKSYVGRMPAPRDWQDAAAMIRRMQEGQFPGLPASDWMDQAANIYVEKDGRIEPDYDSALARPLAGIDLGQSVPTLWPQFDALWNVPTLVLHGVNSDILLDETVEKMAERNGWIEVVHLADMGHAPFLSDMPTIQRIKAFARKFSRARG